MRISEAPSPARDLSGNEAAEDRLQDPGRNFQSSVRLRKVEQALWMAITVVLFFASRSYILTQAVILDSTLSAVDVTYAREFREARARGISLARLHRMNAQAAMAAIGRDISGSPDNGVIGYPPLCVAWMILPDAILRRVAPAGADARRLVQAHRWATAMIDALAFGLLCWMLIWPGFAAGPGERIRRLVAYVLGGILSYHVLYDRMDLLVGFLLLVSLAALVSRWHYWFALAALAAGINFKIIPFVLAPLWLLATLPPAALKGLTMEHVRGLGKRALLLALFTGVCLAPFLFMIGRDSLAFLQLHASRGIQVESTWASILIFLTAFGQQTQIYFGSGSFNVRSPLSPALAAASTIVLILSLMCLTFLFWRYAQRRIDPNERSRSIAAAMPGEMCAWTVLFLVVAMALSKVFSASYVLWLVPLAPLLPFRRRASRLGIGLFLAACALTTLLYPYVYSALIGKAGPGEIPHGPVSMFGASVLDIRNLLFIAFGFVVGLDLRSRHRARVRSAD